jgi:flagellar hook protein FlgE
MAIMTSLISAITGMRNHSGAMDVISNNIANVNTVGFKAQRLSFAESFAQTLKYATSGSSGTGGRNPFQVGLGLKAGAIDTFYNQGTIESTGSYTDLAIDGNELFVVRKGSQNYYTRAGQFVLDPTGYLVHSTTGSILQGYKTVNGEVLKGILPEHIIIPLSDKSEAKPTQNIEFIGNLNSKMLPSGFTGAGSFYAAGNVLKNDARTLITSDGAGNFDSLSSILPGETQITVTDSGLNAYTFYYVIGTPEVNSRQFNNLEELYREIRKVFKGFSYTDNPGNPGQYILADTEGLITSITSNHAALDAVLNASTGLGLTQTFYRPAEATDNITDLVDAFGNSLNPTGDNTDVYTVTWRENGYSNSIKFSAVNTVDELLTNIKDRLPFAQSVTIDPATGKMTILPNVTLTATIQDIGLTASEVDGTDILSWNQSVSVFEDPVGKPVVSNVSLFDSQGDHHLVTFSFTKSATNTWLWTATYQIPGPTADVTLTRTAGYGNLLFTPGGSLAVSTSNKLRMETSNGSSKEILVNINWGAPNTFLGMTQVDNPTGVNSLQDGYAAGDLIDVNIDLAGKIIGNYSNGQSKTLAQVALARFRNPSGLHKEGESLYIPSVNSGEPMLVTLDESSFTSIISRGLELSTVELTEEFTKMIITQRGYQSSARMITTSDEMTQELVNLKR